MAKACPQKMLENMPSQAWESYPILISQCLSGRTENECDLEQTKHSLVIQGIFIPALFLSHSILKGFSGIYHSSNPPSLPNSAFYEFIHQRLPNHDSEVMGERGELENRDTTIGCGAFLCSLSAGGCLCWAEASQMHGIRVSWQRRQAAICLFSFVPLSGKKREEFRKGWRNEMTVNPVPKKHHPGGHHAVKCGPRGDLVAGELTPKVEERNGRGISWRSRTF